MIDFDFNRYCTGCGACADVCPHSCITIQEDRDGFRMPSVDKVACIHCGLCERICPALNQKATPYNNRKCYAVYHTDPQIRHMGSSGSAFYALAKSIIDKGGVVYGASMSGLRVQHTKATKMDEVQSQMKSKYVQSNTNGIYKQVLSDLREGRPVLYVGTPCQCKALHNLTPSGLRDNLLIADIICHGIPSQSLFDKSMAYYEKKNGLKIRAFSFREKTEDSLRNYKVEYEKDGAVCEKVGDLDEIPYCFGFFNQTTWRNSCYVCKHKCVERDSDITLGDFWGLDKLKSDINDFQKGYSSLITNTDRGGQVVEKLQSCVVEKIPDGVAFVRDHNRAYTKPDNRSLMRGLFFFCLRNFGYPFCEKHFLQQQPQFLDRLLRSLVVRIVELQVKLNIYGNKDNRLHDGCV